MKTTKSALGYHSPDMEMEAEPGDFLPRAIYILHNEKIFKYQR